MSNDHTKSEQMAKAIERITLAMVERLNQDVDEALDEIFGMSYEQMEKDGNSEMLYSLAYDAIWEAVSDRLAGVQK